MFLIQQFDKYLLFKYKNIYINIQQGLTHKELNENPKFVQVDLKNGKFNCCQILHVDLVSEFEVIYGRIFLNSC